VRDADPAGVAQPLRAVPGLRGAHHLVPVPGRPHDVVRATPGDLEVLRPVLAPHVELEFEHEGRQQGVERGGVSQPGLAFAFEPSLPFPRTRPANFGCPQSLVDPAYPGIVSEP